MNYSNVTRPERPEYDQVLYPYAIVEFRYQLGQSDWYELRLYYSRTAFSYNGDVGCILDGGGETCVRVCGSDGLWSEERVMAMAVILGPGLGTDMFRRVWTEQDIADAEGRLYLGAGEVTSGDWKGLKSWVLGLVQGLSWTPFRANPKTTAPQVSEAYTYNTVVLPGLPEIITEQLEIVICWVPSEGGYRVFASWSYGTRLDTSTGYLRSTSSAAVTYYISDYVSGGWGTIRTVRIPNNSAITNYVVKPVWSNRDFYTRDGKFYLEGSEPVLVVPEDRVERDLKDEAIWLLGRQTGRRLVKQRNTRQEVTE